MSELIYLNGGFLPQEQAHVSVMDRGFLFGDGVYEVIPAYAGLPFRLKEHLQRLNASLEAIRMSPPLSDEQWRAVFGQLLAQRGNTDQQIYLQVTRGAYGKRLHAIPEEVTPTVMAFATDLAVRDPELVKQGMSVITLDDIRWERCNIKAITLLANILSQQQARDEGAQEAILVRDGLANEGTASNLFIVKEGLIITPPKSQHLLPGITRDLVLELAREAGLPYAEASISVAELENAEEIWITSSTKEVMPVTRLNGLPVDNGHPGPIWEKMDALYGACKARLRLRNSPPDNCYD
ncbi:MAG TPA: D-amino acid aminotransferase [Thiolapillus brandeum]|uniref:Aminodeoxychorismate lyase n=1 Tax=Thiolapillus brandeum TaxID=1076588 RepID=A0A831RXK0_9GAMM|nr:D-amino acid aminotransferase [Thiolapillus brandeum]